MEPHGIDAQALHVDDGIVDLVAGVDAGALKLGVVDGEGGIVVCAEEGDLFVIIGPDEDAAGDGGRAVGGGEGGRQEHQA